MSSFTSKSKVKSYKGHDADLQDLQTQKEHILSYCGPRYFPGELQNDTFNTRGPRTRVKLKKKHTDKQSDGESNSDGTGRVRNLKHTALDDDGDFGGEDYAHDYYQDEEREEVDDGEEGGLF